MISTLTPETSSIGTVARKRRRQILQSQRTKTEEDVSPPLKKHCSEPITSPAPRKISDAQTSLIPTPLSPNSKAKKPQMRYDPDVPMTKEEAAAWRKEQRRKRNRESAAASRQRQRDRISELEQEVTEWKSKYDKALARIERLEQLKESNTVDCDVVTMRSASNLPLDSAAVSLCGSPRYSPCPSPSQSCESPCGVVSLQEQNHCEEMDSSIACQLMQESNDHVKHLSEKISRPAVKITGATHDSSIPVLPTSNEFTPDPCTSLSSNVMPLSEENILPPVSPTTKCEESLCLSDELEFDEFLLDAAEWL